VFVGVFFIARDVSLRGDRIDFETVLVYLLQNHHFFPAHRTPNIIIVPRRAAQGQWVFH
jgi:hypothetical protein